MTPKVELEIQFTSLYIKPNRFYATFETDCPDDPQIVIDTKNAFKQTYGATFLNYERHRRLIQTHDFRYETSVLVWSAEWIRDRASVFPFIMVPHEDYVFKYDLPML